MTQTSSEAYLAGLDARAEKIQQVEDGMRFAWRRWGSGPAVVLLHGGAGGWMHWARNIEALAGRFTVLAPDMPGFGDSDLPREGLDADSIAPYVERGIASILGQEPFDLVGFSFGSMVASFVAAKGPPALKALVLVSASSLGLFAGMPDLRSLRGVAGRDERRAVLRHNLLQMMLADPTSIDELALTIQETVAPRDRNKNRKLARTDVNLMLAAARRCRAFGIWGRQDFAYRDRFDDLLARVPNLRLDGVQIIEDGGHWVQYEQAEAFNAALLRFLGQPGAGAGGAPEATREERT
ncbi:alpha/beta fold hydrolase [Pigmentiphaga soli]|uniref:Alpha/beta fold hydrolase n=1 Tax=Pigmentiphaga soli TaxID=1007095 RepID=A0ABP8H9G3_9BURK